MEIPVAVDVDAVTASPEVEESAEGRKRFREMREHVPVVTLSSDGMLQHVTTSARNLLEYRSNQRVEPCFFTHVHGKNLYQVMRDVADMVCYGKSQASWLLRLRTGQGRWRWYKATVLNRLNDEQSIQIQLHDQSGW